MKKALSVLALLVFFGRLGYNHYTGRLPEDFKVNNLENGRIITLGHGGMGTRAWHDINTQMSFLDAMESGADGTELDVQLTADSVLVAFHDERIGEAKCPKHIAQHTFAELKACDHDLMQVVEVLQLGWPDGRVFSLDVKLHGADEAHRQILARRISTLRTIFPQFRILVESTEVPFMEMVKENGVTFGLYLYTDDAVSGLATCTRLGLEGISIRNDAISAAQVEACHAQGIRVMLWGIGSRWDNRSAALKSPDLMQSDKLGPLVKLLSERR